ncbi:uncharacterized protein LOC143579335 isoform X2 [Bidens hawaiensis]|uniref:uncharacterized protein LOC143579335 isoform X2 n=1 Tax=Bidens hawaiensis TaxID=980011 RepID=UPI00404A2B13
MASSGKFDLSSVSSDRPLYSSARGSYAAASLDRSSSFHDNMENPIVSSLPSMSRSTSAVSQVDVTNFFQCLRFDPKSMAAEHKFNRHGDFKRLASAVLGSPDESPSGSFKGKVSNFSPDDLKRFKAGLRESTIKARERVKVFSETLSVVNKCFPSIPSRKRSRLDVVPSDRASGLLVNRAHMGTGVGRMSTQSHSLTNAFDFDQQKADERGKSVIPNKRTRTSMVEARPNTPARSSGNMDREKETLRLSNNNASQNEDRSLPIVAEGWEKPKMKKKRTVIKPDTASSPSLMSTKANDGYRESKQGMHPRHVPDAMSRLNGPAQQSGVGMRSSIPRPEQERDRSTSSEKERTSLRSVNKSNVREEFVSGSPTSSTKLNGTGPVRGPRSGSNAVAKLSTVGQRATASSDWDVVHGTNKNPGSFGSTNRKRTPSTRSPSPPVAQWADRRPQKISRTARRTNLVPILSTSDEVPGFDNTSDVTGSESGPGLTKRFANSPQRFKSKGDHFPSSTFSESEESGAAEIRSRDKGKKSDEVEEKSQQNGQKMSTLFPPVRKNKAVNGEAVGDGVCRAGRTGRGFGSARGFAPAVEKIRSEGTAKQLRTARLSFDKSESKPGRPPTRKLSDRKAYTRQKQTPFNAAVDFPVGSDDGQEELMAVAKAVLNPTHALSNPFWRQMEPLFGFISDVDMSYIKQQGITQSIMKTLNPGQQDNETASLEGIPLCQRLLAALISEEGNEELLFSGNNDHCINVYGSSFEFETHVESSAVNPQSLHNYELGGRGNLPRSFSESIQSPPDRHIVPMSELTAFTDYQYNSMSINERLLVEIQSIGLYPELVPDSPCNENDGIDGEIQRLERKRHEQISRKKNLLDNLLESTNEARELQEKEFEQLCIDKLTAIAYQKYMSCWGPHAPKSVGSKVAKQAALGFVRRVLDRCHEFEATGKSCFNEPLYKEMLRSGSSHLTDAQLEATTDTEFGTQPSPLLNNHEIYPSGSFNFSEQTISKNDSVWSSRVKKRELYLDDVVAGTSSGIGTKIINSAKGKRSERDRDGKVNRLSRNGGLKVGRPASVNVKGERKNKPKPKQKTTYLSASFNSPVENIEDQNRTFSSVNTVNESIDYKQLENSEEPLDFFHLQLPEMDVLDVQGEDIGSWLNIDDDVLQDDDFMGLEIPMDDLSDLNMMV